VFRTPVAWASSGTAPRERSSVSLRSEFRHEVAEGLRSHPSKAGVVAESDLAPLPPAVQRYLRVAGAVGKPYVWNYRLRFRGKIRTGPDSRWMKMEADQQSFVEPAARLFLMKASMFGLPVAAFHRYVGPEATFRVRVASLLTVVDARGAEMNRGETVTLLNDMCLLAPATLVDPRFGWEELDPLTVRVTFANAGNNVSAVLSFDRSGALANFTSDDRYRTVDGKTYERLPWSTPIQAWRTFDGTTLPAVAETAWHEQDREYAYGRFEVVSIAYNVGPG